MHKLLEKFDTIDRLTPALRRVKKEVTKQLQYLPKYASFGEIPFETFREVLESLGFEMENEWDSNGWEHDTWTHFHNYDKKVTYEIYSSWYSSRTIIRKVDYDTRRN